MIPVFPVIELFDRLVIAKIKWQRTGANALELEFYESQTQRYNLDLIQDLLAQLTEVHNTIWDLEKELKSDTEQQLDLSEVGRRAVQIRNWNKKRIAIKNLIAEKLHDHVFEIKHDHLSQSVANQK